jgi:signal transduction histidine kinase
LLDAVQSVGSDLDLEIVLRRVTEVAVELVGARYGALGVLSPERTHLSDFITVGLPPEQAAEIGELPKGHGILGVLIDDPRPLRLPDLSQHPDSFGFPPHHPPMTSFLGVPVFVSGQAFGNLYLTDKADDEVFTDIDEELVVGLASAAGTAIEKTRLHERVREMDLIEDRGRIARDLHDTVIQRLFATGLGLQSVARLAEPIPELAERIQTSIDELDLVVRQIRSSIFELQTAEAYPTGLRTKVMALGDDLSDALGAPPTFRFEGPIDTAVPDRIAGHLLATVGEALTNAARHAKATHVTVLVKVDPDQLQVTVDDDGRGPGPARAEGRGLANLASRAAELGGMSRLEERPGGGSRLRWSVPLA